MNTPMESSNELWQETPVTVTRMLEAFKLPKSFHCQHSKIISLINQGLNPPFYQFPEFGGESSDAKRPGNSFNDTLVGYNAPVGTVE